MYLADSYLVTCIFNLFCSITETNAWLDRGQMFVLSTQHIELLLGVHIWHSLTAILIVILALVTRFYT